MDRPQRIVVIGGGYAGVIAALRAARSLQGEAEVVLVSDSDALVERIRLHETAARGRDPRRALPRIFAGTSVRLVHARADAIDRARRTVDAAGQVLEYDRLIVAIGSRIDRDAIRGAPEHAFTLDPEDASKLAHAARMTAERGGHVVVIGGGLTGLEAATELAEHHPGARITLATSGTVGERLSERAAAHVREALARLEITLLEHARATRIEAAQVVFEERTLPFDVCVWAGGFVPPVSLARWGFPRDARGRARVDAMLRLEGSEDVYVAGDCASVSGALGSPLPMGCKTAMPLGAHAAGNAVRSLRGEPELPFDWVDPGLCISLGRRDAVIQLVPPDGPPSPRYVRGIVAAWLKELVCRYTMVSLALERLGLWRYRWLRSRAPLALAEGPPVESGSTVR